MSSLRSAPLRYLSLLLGCWLGLFTLTRSVLLIGHWPEAALSLTDLPGLYLTGSTSHPGGSVSGRPGRNTARTVLADLGLTPTMSTP